MNPAASSLRRLPKAPGIAGSSVFLSLDWRSPAVPAGAFLWPIFLSLVLFLSVGTASAAERPDFSGSWHVDLEASDEVARDLSRRLVERQRENTRKDLVDLQAEGVAFGGDRRTSNRERRDNDNLGGTIGALLMSRLLDYVVASGAHWEIEQSEQGIELVTADGTLLNLEPKRGARALGTGTGTVDTKWKGKRLVSTLTLEDRSTIRQTWKLLDPGRMEVVSRISVYTTPRTPVRPLSLRMVYERVPRP